MPRKPNVVVTSKCFPETLELLRAEADLVANPGPEAWTYHEVLRQSRTANAVMAFMPDRLDAAFFAACPDLRIVGAVLKGFDNIDAAAATRAGVWVTIVPDLLTIPTAELAIGLMLSVGRNIHSADRAVRAGEFQGWRPRFYGRGLANETVGIVGFGCVGQAIADRLRAFNCRILAYDSNAVDLARAGSVEFTQLGDLVSRSDYVVLALPLNESTQKIVDRDLIARMQNGAYLINPARGSLVDEAAIADALERGHLAGYAADVFEFEDWARPGRPAHIEPRLIKDLDRTVLTPHIGSATVDARRRIELSAAQSILECLRGEKPSLAINHPDSVHV